jgi:hypothetical protein
MPIISYEITLCCLARYRIRVIVFLHAKIGAPIKVVTRQQIHEKLNLTKKIQRRESKVYALREKKRVS